ARDGSAEPVTDVRGIVQFDPGQDHDELVSAVTCDEVVTAYRACQRGSHALQHEIPTEMSVDAVHGMEVVEVEHSDDSGDGQFVEFVDPAFTVASVRQTGQRVGQRLTRVPFHRVPQHLVIKLGLGGLEQPCGYRGDRFTAQPGGLAIAGPRGGDLAGRLVGECA